MVDDNARDGLDEALERLQGRLEQECRQALGDEQPEALTEEIQARVREKVSRELRAELIEVLGRLGREIAEELDAKIQEEEKVRRREEEFLRFGLQFRIQHMIMFVSVFLLIFTGLPLKFPDLVISEYLISLFGGIQSSTVLHRIGASGLIFVAVYHTFYTFLSRQGRRDFFLLLPRPQDVKDLFTQVKYFLGRSDEPARFDRFSYAEKFDYWAVYWGCVIMIGTGAMLWFQEISLLYLPKYFLDIAKEAHSDEALLATLAILIWHFYNVHFNPAHFPGSLTWWHGRISREEMMEHHPLEYERILAEQAARAVAEAEVPTDEGQAHGLGPPTTLQPPAAPEGRRDDGPANRAVFGPESLPADQDDRRRGED